MKSRATATGGQKFTTGTVSALRGRQLLAGIAAAAIAASATAFRYSDAQSEALTACKRAAEWELGLGNYSAFDRQFGMNRVSRDEYEFYLNVAVRDRSDREARPVMVYCRSAGFAKVREIQINDGAWVYKTDGRTVDTLEPQVATGQSAPQ